MRKTLMVIFVMFALIGAWLAGHHVFLAESGAFLSEADNPEASPFIHLLNGFVGGITLLFTGLLGWWLVFEAETRARQPRL